MVWLVVPRRRATNALGLRIAKIAEGYTTEIAAIVSIDKLAWLGTELALVGLVEVV